MPQLTDKDKKYIAENWATLSCRAMARELHCNRERTVNCILPRMVGWRFSFPRTGSPYNGEIEAFG